MPDQPGGLFQLRPRDPADRLDRLGRIPAAHLGIELKGGATDDFAVRTGHPALALQRDARCVAIVAAGNRIVRHEPRGCRIPGEIAAPVAVRRQIALGQQAPRVGAHQQGTVAPEADEVAVIPPFLNHQVCEAKSERPVRAWTHPHPHIGLAGEPNVARVDHDQPHAALETCDGGGRVGQTRGAGVIAPQDETTGVGDIGHGAVPAAKGHTADAKSVAGGEAAAPSAHLNVAAGIGRAERVHQTPDEAVGVRDGAGRGRRHAEGDALRPVPLSDPPHGRCGHVQGLIPADPLPPRVGIALGTGSTERMRQSFPMIDKLRAGATLCAERLSGWVGGVGIEAREAAVLHGRHRAATRDAQAAIARDSVRVGKMRHGVLPSMIEGARIKLTLRHWGPPVQRDLATPSRPAPIRPIVSQYCTIFGCFTLPLGGATP